MLNEMLRKRREDLGITREKICEGLCSPSTLYRYEYGHNDINTSTFVQLCMRLSMQNVDFEISSMYNYEFQCYLYMQNLIYEDNNKDLTILLSSIKKNYKNFSDKFIKILDWAEAVVEFNNKNYLKSKDILLRLCPRFKINDNFDINILNSLTLIMIVEEDYLKAQNTIEICDTYIYENDIKSIQINIKVKYNYAYVLHKNGYNSEAINMIESMLKKLHFENSFFMMAKLYFFQYILLIHKKSDQEKAYNSLQLSYYMFNIEKQGSSIPTVVQEEYNKMKCSSSD